MHTAESSVQRQYCDSTVNFIMVIKNMEVSANSTAISLWLHVINMKMSKYYYLGERIYGIINILILVMHQFIPLVNREHPLSIICWMQQNGNSGTNDLHIQEQEWWKKNTSMLMESQN